MKITPEKIETDKMESISWDKVKLMRLINQNLYFVLKNRKKIEFKGLNRNQIDLAFKFYYDFVKSHPN